MIPPSIVNFIHAEQIATVCCIADQAPHCFNCFYAFEEEEEWLIYKSSGDTRHDAVLAVNRYVAGTIIPNVIAVKAIQGIQFEGMLITGNGETTAKASACYHGRFPFSRDIPGIIHVFELHKIKFTDNTKGFGHKEHWKKGE